MDAYKIQRYYLQAIYGGLQPENVLDKEANFVLQNMSPDRLQVERAARLRNLRTVLHGDMKLMNQKVSKEALLPLVQAYASASCFWQHRGRSLIEDFCLFVAESNDVDPVTRLLAHVEGVYSGLSVSPTKKTPWLTHDMTRENNEVIESFDSPMTLNWEALRSEKNTYQVEVQASRCQLRRADGEIRIKFSERQAALCQ